MPELTEIDTESLPIIGVSVDGGHNSMKTCVWFEGEEYHLKMSSNIALGNLTKVQSARSSHGKDFNLTAKAMMKRNEFFLEEDGGVEEMVGDIAGRQNLTATTGIGYAARYWKGHIRKYAMVSIAAHLPPGKYRAIITTGMPAETWGKVNNAKVRASLVGKWNYKVNGLSYTMVVENSDDVRVLKEGAAVVRAHALDDEREGAYYGGIDIGGGTTDLHVYQYHDGKADAVADMCGGIEYGTERIIDLAQERFQRDKNTKLTFTYDERQLLMKAYAKAVDGRTLRLDYYPSIAYKSGSLCEPAELHAWMTIGVKYVRGKIEEKLSALWREGYEGDIGGRLWATTLFGGGAYSLKHEIRDIIDTIKVLPSPDLRNIWTYKETCLAFMEENGLIEEKGLVK